MQTTFTPPYVGNLDTAYDTSLGTDSRFIMNLKRSIQDSIRLACTPKLLSLLRPNFKLPIIKAA